jgi:hypothetical protein
MRNGLALLFPALLVAAGLIAGELRSSAKRIPKPPRPAARVWLRRAAEFAGSDLLAVVLILVIAILVTLNFVLWFPDLGAAIEQCEQF